jgi:muconolactone delta-isomerase
MPLLLEGFTQWRAKWRDKMPVFEFWAGRGGGLGIVDVADATELSQMMMEFPFAQFLQIDVRLIVDGDDALERLKATMAEMTAAMQG